MMSSLKHYIGKMYVCINKMLVPTGREIKVAVNMF